MNRCHEVIFSLSLCVVRVVYTHSYLTDTPFLLLPRILTLGVLTPGVLRAFSLGLSLKGADGGGVGHAPLLCRLVRGGGGRE
jgi:hypothetical protein